MAKAVDAVDSKDAPTARVLNTLWIISLFVGLCEVVVGVATTQATGWIQAVLAIFSVAFPAVVCLAFFIVLWKKPFVFYAPRDYPETVPVRDFVGALVGATVSDTQVVEAALRKAIDSAVPAVDLSENPDFNGKTVAEGAFEVAKDELLHNSVQVDLSAISRRSIGPILLSLPTPPTVVNFLNSVWFQISDVVPPSSYGDRWILRDVQSGKVYDEMGTRWAVMHTDSERDLRLLRDLGIRPGARLEVREL